VLAGAAFLLNQTTVGVAAAALLERVLRSPATTRERMRVIGAAAVGFALVVVPAAAFFAAHGALDDLWSAAFAYNFAEAQSSDPTKDRLAAVGEVLDVLSRTGLSLFGIAGCLWFCLCAVRVGPSWSQQPALLRIAAIALPLDLFSATATAKPFWHYAITMLPTLTIFTGYALASLRRVREPFARPVRTAAALVLGILVILTAADHVDQLQQWRVAGAPEVIEYVRSHTGPTDTVLVWGAEPAVNFFAGRKAPTRYVYLYPLEMPGYTRPGMVRELLDGVAQNRPRLIVDAYDQGLSDERFAAKSPDIEAALEELHADYRAVDRIDGWTVYERVAGELGDG
jgi:hypothetical protein